MRNKKSPEIRAKRKNIFNYTMFEEIKEIEEFTKKNADIIDKYRSGESYDLYAGKTGIHFRQFGDVKQLFIDNRDGMFESIEYTDNEINVKSAEHFLEAYHEVF